MKFEIRGNEAQTVEIELVPGEAVRARADVDARHGRAIATRTHTGGGLWAGAGSSFAGGRLLVTDFTATRRARLAFTPRSPGRIVARRLTRGETLICRRESLLCAENSVGRDLALRRRNPTGFFADDEIVLERLTGPGTVFLTLAGEAAHKRLEAGESLSFLADHLGLHESTVACDLEVGGSTEATAQPAPEDGRFVVTLTGPGRIWLQHMPMRPLPPALAGRRRPTPQPDHPVHVA